MGPRWIRASIDPWSAIVVFEIAAQGQLAKDKPRHRRRFPDLPTRIPAGERHACVPGATSTLCGLTLRISGFERFPGPWEGAASSKSCPQCVAAARRYGKPDVLIDLRVSAGAPRRVARR
jgi:hypothetical protein